MSLRDLFSARSVVTHDDIAQWVRARGARSPRTVESLIAYHMSKGHLIRVRRGLYVVVPPGVAPESCPVEPYLLASKMTDDAVLAYHTALCFHGKAYSSPNWFLYQTRHSPRPVAFRSYRFRSAPFPVALRDGHTDFGVKTAERTGLPVRVTSLERTLVDVLDRPRLSGGWEEIWRSLGLVEFFDLDLVVEYALLLGNATTAAKVGFFLDQHADALMVEEDHLDRLRARRPRQPHYLGKGRLRTGRLRKEWNLIVPISLLERSWEETA